MSSMPLLALILLVVASACREETTDRLDAGWPASSAYQPVHAPAPAPAYHGGSWDHDHHHDETSVMERYLQWRTIDSIFGGSSHAREVHHYHAPAPAVVHSTSTVHVVHTPAPAAKPATAPSVRVVPKSTSYGFKAPTRPSSAPTTFRSVSRPSSFSVRRAR